jgi:type IV secretory pathway TraG/TraD family ATPase VirD4
MFKELLSIVPEHRRQDVVVFDPADSDFPLGLNLLDPGIVFKDEDEKQQRITSNVMSVFEKLADANQWGTRMEHNLRSATLTALQTPNPSLYTIQRLLTDRPYQRAVAKTLSDPVLKQFWQKEFALMGNMQLSSIAQPLTNRLGKFITTKMSRHILLQEKSTINIAEIMDEGKILLVNLSKGEIGEDESNFFGTILTSFIWMAAFQRTKIPESKRRDFFLYVDEFQNFAAPRFAEITSEGRKFRVSLIVSHQNIAQIEDKAILKVMAGNAHTIISLKASPDDEAFILPFMRPLVARGDIVNLAPYHFYMKTTASQSEDALSGITQPVDVRRSAAIRDEVVAYSQQRYGTPKEVVQQFMETLFLADSPSQAKAANKQPSRSSKLHGV